MHAHSVAMDIYRSWHLFFWLRCESCLKNNILQCPFVMSLENFVAPLHNIGCLTIAHRLQKKVICYSSVDVCNIFIVYNLGNLNYRMACFLSATFPTDICIANKKKQVCSLLVFRSGHSN